MDGRNSTDQLKWLDKQLSSLPSTDWKFIISHHPMYTLKKHFEESPEIQEYVLPLIKDRVQAHFAGHVHAMRIMEDDKTDILYLVSGAGGHSIEKPKKHPFAKDTFENAGFMIVDLYSKKMKVQVYNAENGKIEKMIEKYK